jgi:MYXO-CTERM domain-containing protein
MRVFRTTMLVATLATLALGAQLAACGGDDENQAGPPSPDAGPLADASAPATGPTLTVSTSRAKLYLGQSVKIEGATIAPEIASKFVWTVIAAPSASAVTTASIQDAATVSPSLKPDRLGLYTLQLSGEKADGAVASVLVIIEAIDAPVFFRDLHLTGDQTGSSFTMALSTQVAGTYGTEAQTVGCPLTTVTDGGSGGSESTASFASARAGASNGDAWEGPPGTPSRVVFPEFQAGSAGSTVTSRLTVATSSSACGAAEAKVLDTTSGDQGPSPGLTAPTNFIYNARFSPDGNRIAYMNDANGGARLSTIGFDGADKRDLSPVTAVGDGRLEPDAGSAVVPVSGGIFALGPIPPRWKDPTHVGWVSFFGDGAATPDRSEWELWVVEDKPGATAELAMRCSGSALTHFDFLPDGTIVAAARHVVSTAAGDIKPMDLLVYRANAATKACEIVRNLTSYTTDQAIARDFAVSPDKSMIAFFGGAGPVVPTGNPAENITALSTVPVDGSRAAAPVPGVPGAADLGVGPRLAAGGTVITWGQADALGLGSSSGGAPPPMGMGRLMSVPVDGGNTVLVAAGSAGVTSSPDGGFTIDYRLRYGMGQGCTTVPGVVSNGVVLGLGMLGVGTLLARRRRSSTR